MKKLLLFCLSLTYISIYSQVDFNNYTPLKSYGEMPSEYTTFSWEKYLTDQSTINNGDDKLKRESEDEFYLMSNYEIDEMLVSGRVLYGDPLTNYVTEIARELFKDEPEIIDELTIFTFKSTSVNAFATNQGMLFFNVGLLAQVENEAQLAFIIGHEIGHYVNNHAINKYVENKRVLSNSSKTFKALSFDDKMDHMYTRSRELELEADEYGISKYLMSDYHPEEMNTTFDVLHYSYLPFDEVPFDRTFFNNENMIIPESKFGDTTNAITAEEDSDDDNSTHPNISKRREKLFEKMEGRQMRGNKFYIVKNEEEFNYIRNLARFEMIHLNLQRRQYERAIYNCYLLLEEYPENHYLKKSIAYSLYALSMYKNEGDLSDVKWYHKKVEGESSALHYFIQKLDKKELNIITLSYIQELYLENKEDQMIIDLREDLIETIVWDSIFNLDEFSDIPLLAMNDSLESKILDQEVTKPQKKRSSKYAKVLKKKKEAAEKGSFYRHAFAKYINEDNSFSNTFIQFQDEVDSYNEFMSSIEDYGWKKKNKLIEEYLEKYKTEKPVVEKMVIVDPHLEKWDERKGSKHVQSEKLKIKSIDDMSESAATANLDITLLDSKSFSEDGTDKYNDLCFVRSWINERVAHGGLNLIPSTYDQVNSFIERNGTQYTCFSGFSSVRKRTTTGQAVGILAISLIYWPALPFSIYYIAKPKHRTDYAYLVFDLKTGKVPYFQQYTMKNKYKSWVTKSHLYELFTTVQNPKKDK